MSERQTVSKLQLNWQENTKLELMGTHEYYSRVRVLLTRHFLMGTRGPRVLVEALVKHQRALIG